MTSLQRRCFVIMPFTEELHYFYLYLQRHIEEKHGVQCQRGDADVLTVPLLDKIRAYVENADVLIADCSGRNPNVFYELGMAHALGKKVILITKDPVEGAPTDIRHFEFIRYELGKHREFLDQLDRALRAVFVEGYESLYELARDVFQEFRKDMSPIAEMEKKEVFLELVVAAEQRGEVPPLDQRDALREFVLPRIVANKDQRDVIDALSRWYAKELSGQHRTDGA